MSLRQQTLGITSRITKWACNGGGSMARLMLHRLLRRFHRTANGKWEAWQPIGRPFFFLTKNWLSDSNRWLSSISRLPRGFRRATNNIYGDDVDDGKLSSRRLISIGRVAVDVKVVFRRIRLLDGGTSSFWLAEKQRARNNN